MNDTVISLLQTTGLGVFIWYLISSLKSQIKGLESLVETQSQTIRVMDKRIEETEKIGGIYKNLLSDLPTDIDNYKTFISKTKDSIIVELQLKHDEAQAKLKEVEDRIRSSQSSAERIDMRIKVLKNLLTMQMSEHGFPRPLELLAICEFGGRRIEDCVATIVDESNLESFLARIGYRVEPTEDSSITKTLVYEKRLPSGVAVAGAMASSSMDGGWYCLADDWLFANAVLLNKLKKEFSAVKSRG